MKFILGFKQTVSSGVWYIVTHYESRSAKQGCLLGITPWDSSVFTDEIREKVTCIRTLQRNETIKDILKFLYKNILKVYLI